MTKVRRAPGTCVSWNKTHKKWVGYIVIGTKINGKGETVPNLVYRRSATPGRPGEREVEDALERAVGQLEDDRKAAEEAADPRNYTLWQAVMDWHRWAPMQPKTSQQTADKLLGQATKWIKPRIGGESLFDVDLEMLTNFFEEIAENLGQSSLNDLKSTLIRAMNRAMSQKSQTGFTGPNVAKDVDLPEAGHKPRAKDFLTQEQVEAVLTAAEGTLMYALMTLGFMLGLRPGEIRALKWEHIDLQRGVLYVVKYARKTGDGPTKTLASRRGMKLPARLLAALRHHRERYGDHGYVFTREDGKQFDKDGLSWRTGKMFRAAGLDLEDPYVMRHTFASVCYSNDIPVKKISELMGHANERVTLAVYIHIFNPDVADTDGLDDIWTTAA